MQILVIDDHNLNAEISGNTITISKITKDVTEKPLRVSEAYSSADETKDSKHLVDSSTSKYHQSNPQSDDPNWIIIALIAVMGVFLVYLVIDHMPRKNRKERVLSSANRAGNDFDESDTNNNRQSDFMSGLTGFDAISIENLYKAAVGERNQIYYLTKFEQFDREGQGPSPTWNWPAFLFADLWALYRKMYGWFLGLWGISILFCIAYYYRAPIEVLISSIAIRIIFAICANSLYHKTIQKKIAAAKRTVKDDRKLLEYLKYKGGVHQWVVWLFVIIPVVGAVLSILIPNLLS